MKCSYCRTPHFQDNCPNCGAPGELLERFAQATALAYTGMGDYVAASFAVPQNPLAPLTERAVQ